jgi:TolA-binding protein
MSGASTATGQQTASAAAAPERRAGWIVMAGLRPIHRFLDSRFLQTLVFMAMTLVAMMLLVEVHQLNRSSQRVEHLQAELQQLNQTMAQLNNLTFLQTDLLYNGRLSAAQGSAQSAAEQTLEAIEAEATRPRPAPTENTMDTNLAEEP